MDLYILYAYCMSFIGCSIWCKAMIVMIVVVFCNGFSAVAADDDAFAEPATSCLDYRARFIAIFIFLFIQHFLFPFITFTSWYFSHQCCFFSLTPSLPILPFLFRLPCNDVRIVCMSCLYCKWWICVWVCGKRVCVWGRKSDSESTSIDSPYSLSLIRLFISHRQCLFYCLLATREVLLPSVLLSHHICRFCLFVLVLVLYLSMLIVLDRLSHFCIVCELWF